MQIYLVGGAVRDALLGLPVQDRDWVVVGATPQQMTALGFMPVGRDFPVFLHPVTKEEYALARTERKSAPGYRGFVVHAATDVTLEQDLARRDLTLNAIAYDIPPEFPTLQKGLPATPLALDPARLIDPFGGQADVRNKVLRHVTAAFSEDPVRVLRVARFAARFGDFSVAPETLALMRQMVANGETLALVAERVWQELATGLMSPKPSRMLAVMQACGVFAHTLPPLRDPTAPAFAALDRAAGGGASLAVRFACLMMDLKPQPGFLSRVPRACNELFDMLEREHAVLSQLQLAPAEAWVDLFERCDAFRKPLRFVELLEAHALHATATRLDATGAVPDRRLVLDSLEAARGVTASNAVEKSASTTHDGPQMALLMRSARIHAVARACGA